MRRRKSDCNEWYQLVSGGVDEVVGSPEGERGEVFFAALLPPVFFNNKSVPARRTCYTHTSSTTCSVSVIALLSPF